MTCFVLARRMERDENDFPLRRPGSNKSGAAADSPAGWTGSGRIEPAEPIGLNPRSQLDAFVVSPSTTIRKIGDPPSQIEPSCPAAPCMLGRW